MERDGSNVVSYDGRDIIITDPCYLTNGMGCSDEIDDRFDDAWDGDYFHGVQCSTIYGDWSCKTIDMNSMKTIGEFCADSGMVCVVDYCKVKEFNPMFNFVEEKPWTTTLIRNFKGDVQIKTDTKDGERIRYVEGHGVNSVTGERIDFITAQGGW